MAKQAAILMLLFLRVCFAASLTNMSDTDMSSLLSLKSGFNSDVLAKNWSRETSFCTWIGVTCSRRRPRVTALDLSSMDLHGKIGGEIGNLSFLTFLDARNNSLRGRIPGEIGKLRRLRVLILSNNYFSGDIPAFMQLNILRLNYNNLTGNIPLSFGNSSQLQLLELSGNQLTVKVFNLDVQDAFKSFDTECQILRNIRHRNLVKVITSCSNLDFKALVMAYMPNGNLEKWIYSGDCSLNICQRLEIMIDVASAIEYLHEGDTSPIVHCDLKPNNILLDEDMVAHVGDFGIAKLLTQEQRMLHTKTLGTIGYIAPEYGSEGLVSTMVDVYSYGILLMEVFTRRRPTDEMFTGELTMRRWVSESFPNSIMQIVDIELLNENYQRSRAKHERCLISAMELGLECTSDLAENRPNMKDVVSRTNKIKMNILARDN